MSFLTKTCEYAILITIQQGRYFNQVESVRIKTELDLKLPPSIDDLIPQTTTLSTPVIRVDSQGNCAFNLSLVYYVSFKQLIRLRKLNAPITLTVHLNAPWPTSQLSFTMSEAKEVVPQAGHKFDQIYKFVSDKGSWCSLSHTQQQIKAGLFYVAMPDTNNATVASTPCIQLRSPPSTPLVSTSINSTLKKKKKAVTSILGTAITTNASTSTSTSTNRKKKLAAKEKEQPPPPPPPSTSSSSLPPSSLPRLRRVKSSLKDMNIEELADALKNVHLFHPHTQTPPPVPPVPPVPSKSFLSFHSTTPPQLEQQSYHQIGKGASQYTFYFRIMYADHLKSVLKDTPKRLKKPFISYSFLTHYTLAPAASISSQPTPIKSCYSLRGHLIEIQDWLDAQQYISLDYLLMDKWSKQTMGKARVPLEGIAFEGQEQQDRVYPVYNENKEQLATVTVRIGIVSGWHQEAYFRQKEEERQRRTYIPPTPSTGSLTEESLLSPTMVDSWDTMLHQPKKMRHHSQSSVPTLLTSSTSTKSSIKPTPSIHLVQTRPTSTASYLKKPSIRHLSSSVSSGIYRHQRKQCM